MLSGRIKKEVKKIHFRLILLFSFIFILASFALFFFSFFTLYSSMKSEDSDIARRRLLNYWAVFQTGGIDRIVEEVKVESYLYGDRPFFVRIADRDNRTIYLKTPEEWAPFEIEKLSTIPIDNFMHTIILENDKMPFHLEVNTVALSDQFFLQIGMSTARRAFFLKLYKRNFIFILGLLVIVGIGSGIFLGYRALKPLRNLNVALKDIAKTGDFSRRIPGSGTGDDIDEIIILFNTLLERIEKLITRMKGTIDSVAHDLRTPMTRLRGTAELALHHPEDTHKLADALSSSLEESDKILALLNTIMDISESESGIMHLSYKTLSLKKELFELCEIYSFAGEEKGITLDLQCPDDIRLKADPSRFRQAVGNVIDNAVKFSIRGGIVSITVSKDNNFVKITVSNEGEGIKSEELPFIWDRLYRGQNRKNLSGMGLGLSIVKAVVNAHGGSVSVNSTNEGSEQKAKTSFTLEFSLERQTITKM